MIEWLKHHYPLDWWMMTTTPAAKWLVVQSVLVKLSIVGGLLAWAFVGGILINRSVQLFPFSIWTNELYVRTDLTVPLFLCAVLAICLIAMVRLSA